MTLTLGLSLVSQLAKYTSSILAKSLGLAYSFSRVVSTHGTRLNELSDKAVLTRSKMSNPHNEFKSLT